MSSKEDTHPHSQYQNGPNCVAMLATLRRRVASSSRKPNMTPKNAPRTFHIYFKFYITSTVLMMMMKDGTGMKVRRCKAESETGLSTQFSFFENKVYSFVCSLSLPPSRSSSLSPSLPSLSLSLFILLVLQILILINWNLFFTIWIFSNTLLRPYTYSFVYFNVLNNLIVNSFHILRCFNVSIWISGLLLYCPWRIHAF